MSGKLCDLCGKAAGSVRYTEIVDDKVTKRLLCQACAEARGLLDEPPQPLVVVQQLLASPPAAKPAAPPEPAPGPDLACRVCGLTFDAFRQQGRLGCGACYEAFAAQLVPLLRKIHAHVRHAGKAPRAYAHKAELRQRVQDLRGELERAVRGEDYERAARLRDEIRGVEREQSLAARVARQGGAEAEEPR